MRPLPPSFSNLATSTVLPSSSVKSSNGNLLVAVPAVIAPVKLPEVSLPIRMVKSLKLSEVSSLTVTESITKSATA